MKLVISHITSGYGERDPLVRFLQAEILREYQVEGLAVTGQWDTATTAGITAYLKALQESADLGPAPADGLFTAAFSEEFGVWLEGMDQEQEPIRTFAAVRESLDYLVAGGVYDLRDVRAVVAPKPTM